MRKERRFRFLINEFQGNLLWRIVMYWVIYQFTVWNFMFFWQVLTEGKGDVVEQYGRFAAGQYPMLLCVVVLIPFFAWDAIKFSLRVAGPLYRIRMTIQALEAGKPLRPVKLRDGDYLQEVIDDLNSLIVHMDDRNLATLDFASSQSKKPEFLDSRSTPNTDEDAGAKQEAMAHSA
jgi:hypothetical protein